MANFDFINAKKHFNKANELAKELNITHLSKQAEFELSHVNQQINLLSQLVGDSKDAFEESQMQEILAYLEEKEDEKEE